MILVFLSSQSFAAGGSFGGGGASGSWGEPPENCKYVVDGLKYSSLKDACYKAELTWPWANVQCIKSGSPTGGNIHVESSVAGGTLNGSYGTYQCEESKCPDGLEKDSTGKCVPKKCPVGETLINGQCQKKQCPAGQALDLNGN
ncbi:hypothetical protein ABDK10_13765, partial [Staphylococcus aureus]